MGVIINPEPPANTTGNNRQVPEGTHGAFRNNIHQNAYHTMSQEEANGEQVMGRDILRREERLSEDEVLREECFNDIKAATPVRGSSEKYRVSKWARENKGA